MTKKKPAPKKAKKGLPSLYTEGAAGFFVPGGVGSRHLKGYIKLRF